MRLARLIASVVIAARTLWQSALFLAIAVGISAAVWLEPTHTPLDIILPGAAIGSAIGIVALGVRDLVVARRNAALLFKAGEIGRGLAARSIFDGATGILEDASGKELGRARARDGGWLYQIGLPDGGCPVKLVIVATNGDRYDVTDIGRDWQAVTPGGFYSIRILSINHD